MKKYKYFTTGLILILFYILFGTIFDGDHTYMLVFTLSTLFFITIIALKKHEPVFFKDCLKIMTPFFVLFFIGALIGLDFSRSILYFIFLPLASLLAYLYLKYKNILIVIGSVLLFYIVGVHIYSTAFSFMSNYDAEKNTRFPNVTLLNKQGKKVSFDDDKVIVLDFWATSCGICFDKFPDLEETAKKYHKNKNVEIYAVNFPLKREKFENNIKILDSFGYNFQKLYAKSSKEIEDSLHFNSFPHLLVIKNGKIRYDGMFETEKNTKIFSIESEINKLLIE
jgi:thiol-disulfide isomerase/thioredoxin